MQTCPKLELVEEVEFEINTITCEEKKNYRWTWNNSIRYFCRFLYLASTSSSLEATTIQSNRLRTTQLQPTASWNISYWVRGTAVRERSYPRNTASLSVWENNEYSKKTKRKGKIKRRLEKTPCPIAKARGDDDMTDVTRASTVCVELHLVHEMHVFTMFFLF